MCFMLCWQIEKILDPYMENQQFPTALLLQCWTHFILCVIFPICQLTTSYSFFGIFFLSYDHQQIFWVAYYKATDPFCCLVFCLLPLGMEKILLILWHQMRLQQSLCAWPQHPVLVALPVGNGGTCLMVSSVFFKSHTRLFCRGTRKMIDACKRLKMLCKSFRMI